MKASVNKSRRRAPLPVGEPAVKSALSAAKRIVVPIDFSAPSLDALRYAARLAAEFGSALELLYVAEHVVYFDQSVSIPGRKVLEEMKGKLGALARREISQPIPVYPHVATGKPFAEIVQFARNHAADLIVIGTHGRSGFEHLLLGSTAERVVRHAPCPVLVVRDPSNRPSSPKPSEGL